MKQIKAMDARGLAQAIGINPATVTEACHTRRVTVSTEEGVYAITANRSYTAFRVLRCEEIFSEVIAVEGNILDALLSVRNDAEGRA